MQKYEKLKKSTKTGLYVAIALIVLATAVSIIGIIRQLSAGRSYSWIHAVINLILMIFVWYYTLVGYKKPHGNMLRYLFFIYGICTLASSLVPGNHFEETEKMILIAGSGLAAMFSTYISGRLNKIEKNKYLLIAVLVIMVVTRVFLISSFSSFNLIRFIGNLSPLICWIALGVAYIARYEEHSAAGLE